MEFGERGKKELQDKVPWFPTTPVKPILPKPVPIYTTGVENQLCNHANEALACFQNSAGAKLNTWRRRRRSALAAGDNARTRVRISFEESPSWSNFGFADQMALGDAPSAAHEGNENGFWKNQFVPAFESQFNGNPMNNPSTDKLLSHPHLSLGQSLINPIHQNHPQGTPCFACCGKTTSSVAPPTPDNAMGTKSTQIAPTQTKMDKRDQGKAVINVSATKLNNNGTPENQKVSDLVTEFAAVSTPFKEDHSSSKVSISGIDLNKAPQQKPKRRKHRPKVITEGKSKRNRKPATQKPVQSKENPTSKRKNVRKKGLDTISTPPAAVTGELTKPLMSESAKKTCRRSLNFDIADQPRDGYSACREDETALLGKEIGVAAEETLTGLAYDLNTLMKQKLSNYMSSLGDTQAPSTSLSKGNLPETKPSSNSVENGKRMDQVTAWDGHENSAKILFKSVAQSSLNDSNSSNRRILTTGLQMGGSKRKHSATIEHTDIGRMNSIASNHNGLPTYQNCWVQFPSIQKKRRSEKGKSSNRSKTSSVTATKDVQVAKCHQEATIENPYALSSVCWISSSQCNVATVPVIIEATEGAIHDTPQAWQTKRRSKVPTRYDDCALLTRIRKCDNKSNHTAKQGILGQTFNEAERPQTCIAALVAEMRAPLTKKKRTKKKISLLSSAYSSTNEMQQHHKFVLESHSLPFSKSSDVIWKNTQTVDALTEQFRHLNMNREATDLVFHGQNALVPYNQQNKKHRGLVQGDGTIIPIKGSFDPIRKQYPRPKVDIDEETNKVWELLMLDINSHGIDGTDEDTIKWWEEERNVFRGRVDSFIARMHLVQGDRRFSQWKGSVVDSVIGVFLTQNVSDHLSSSAFMSLAARFPLKSSSNCKPYPMESTSLAVNTPQVQIVEPEENTRWDEKMVNQSVYDLRSMTIDIIEHSEEKTAVNSNDSCITTGSLINLANENNSQRRKSAENLGDAYDQYVGMKNDNLEGSSVTQGSLIASIIPPNGYTLKMTPNTGVLEVDCQDPFKIKASSSGGFSKNKHENDMNKPGVQTAEYASQIAIIHSQSMPSHLHLQEQSNHKQQNFSQVPGQSQDIMQKERENGFGDHNYTVSDETSEVNSTPIKSKSKVRAKDKMENFDWDSLRIQAEAKEGKREKTENTMDSLDWDAVRCADVKEIADAIKERGMNNMLAERIKNFLNRLVEAHGSIDLEWLRDVPPDKAKEYLLSIRGLGLKSVECVRLLTLHHLAFPVDTNVGRIAVRLGWVPLQPLPESLQLHLLELYPILESIQKYLWPRLCRLDQRTLYELHYQMITFGKVFCTKSKPNCNACPMRGECRHFASAFASARLALPGPEQRSVVSKAGNNETDHNPPIIVSQLPLPLPERSNQAEEIQQTKGSMQLEAKSEINICQPIIEEPASPEPECSQVSENDIEDGFYDDSYEIPTIKLNMEEFTLNLQNYMQEKMELQECEMSKALVALTPEVASIPLPKLKNVSRLRTDHSVYELPDSHPLLEGWDKREPDDPGKYLLAIWTPGETANSIQPPERKCNSQECDQLCTEKECFTCNSFREANSQIVRGTLLIPCRTAMRGSFPLNGTYFQVNEVFADHVSSLHPISVPRSWIWNLHRRTVYFGTSIPTIFKGLSTQEIQQCFWRGYVCVRGFERETRAPRPLMARLHFPQSKMAKANKESTSANSQGLEPNPEFISSSQKDLQGSGRARA